MSGNVTAMRTLGSYYTNGITVDTDLQKAFHWYETASKFGDVSSKHIVGVMYRDGTGVEKNLEKALECFVSAAEQGYIHSVMVIIKMYESESAKEEDFKFALNKLEQIALGGNVTAMRNMGTLYLDGKSVDKDTGKSKEWFKKAASMGDGYSRNKLKSMD